MDERPRQTAAGRDPPQAAEVVEPATAAPPFTNRLAREASPYDDITVNVVSIEEAERVLQEKQALMRVKAS